MPIKLTPQVRSYAQAVANVGERMSKTANGFGEVSERKVSSLGDIRKNKNDYEHLLNEFKSQEKTLKNIAPPESLKVEHEKLVVSYGKYVDATEKAIESLDVENVKTDEELLKKAQKLQWEASGEIVEISNIMARKLGIK